jgi:alpha-1,6-mannosyltransferase
VKICTLTQSYADTGGGALTVANALRAWVRTRPELEHVLVIPGAADTLTRDGPLTTRTIASRHVPGSSVYRLLLRSREVLRVLRAERPDVIELYCAYNLPWTALWYRRRAPAIVAGFYFTDVPVAYVEAPVRARIGSRAARWARRATEAYLRALYSRCDVVITISPALCARLQSLGVTRTQYVPLGVDVDTFHPLRRDPAVRAQLGVRADELLLIYAGRLDREKRPDVVLEAFARLPRDFGAVLALIGEGPLRARLTARAAEIGRAHVMQYERDRTQFARLLASADIYVSAMPFETFGLSVIEAQACGLAVVGVRAGAMIDRVADGEGFLVQPDSPAALAERILLTPREQWRCMGQRARARVATEFSWTRTFDTLLQIYQTHR